MGACDVWMLGKCSQFCSTPLPGAPASLYQAQCQCLRNLAHMHAEQSDIVFTHDAPASAFRLAALRLALCFWFFVLVPAWVAVLASVPAAAAAVSDSAASASAAAASIAATAAMLACAASTHVTTAYVLHVGLDVLQGGQRTLGRTAGPQAPARVITQTWHIRGRAAQRREPHLGSCRRVRDRHPRGKGLTKGNHRLQDLTFFFKGHRPAHACRSQCCTALRRHWPLQHVQ